MEAKMKIRIDAPATRTIYPDVEGNAELPEGERFAVVMYRPPRYKLYMQSAHVEVDGTQDVDVQRWALGHVKEIVNPPTLDIDGTEREMRPSDIFEFAVFEPLANEVLTIANELSAKESGTKNS